MTRALISKRFKDTSYVFELRYDQEQLTIVDVTVAGISIKDVFDPEKLEAAHAEYSHRFVNRSI